MGIFFKSKEQKEYLSNLESYGKETYYQAILYLGGHPNIDEKAPGMFRCFDSNAMLFTSFQGNKVYQFELKPKNIKNAEIKTEEQVTKEISLGRVVMFGAIGAMAKKNKVIKNNYLILECEENGIEYNILFETNEPQKIISNINKIRIAASH